MNEETTLILRDALARRELTKIKAFFANLHEHAIKSSLNYAIVNLLENLDKNSPDDLKQVFAKKKSINLVEILSTDCASADYEVFNIINYLLSVSDDCDEVSVNCLKRCLFDIKETYKVELTNIIKNIIETIIDNHYNHLLKFIWKFNVAFGFDIYLPQIIEVVYNEIMRGNKDLSLIMHDVMQKNRGGAGLKSMHCWSANYASAREENLQVIIKNELLAGIEVLYDPCVCSFPFDVLNEYMLISLRDRAPRVRFELLRSKLELRAKLYLSYMPRFADIYTMYYACQDNHMLDLIDSLCIDDTHADPVLIQIFREFDIKWAPVKNLHRVLSDDETIILYERMAGKYPHLFRDAKFFISAIDSKSFKVADALIKYLRRSEIESKIDACVVKLLRDQAPYATLVSLRDKLNLHAGLYLSYSPQFIEIYTMYYARRDYRVLDLIDSLCIDDAHAKCDSIQNAQMIGCRGDRVSDLVDTMLEAATGLMQIPREKLHRSLLDDETAILYERMAGKYPHLFRNEKFFIAAINRGMFKTADVLLKYLCRSELVSRIDKLYVDYAIDERYPQIDYLEKIYAGTCERILLRRGAKCLGVILAAIRAGKFSFITSKLDPSFATCFRYNAANILDRVVVPRACYLYILLHCEDFATLNKYKYYFICQACDGDVKNLNFDGTHRYNPESIRKLILMAVEARNTIVLRFFMYKLGWRNPSFYAFTMRERYTLLQSNTPVAQFLIVKKYMPVEIMQNMNMYSKLQLQRFIIQELLKKFYNKRRILRNLVDIGAKYYSVGSFAYKNSEREFNQAATIDKRWR